MGLNSRTKSIAARVCALAKLPKSLQMHFTSQLPVTSGYCTVWQKRGHNAGQEHSYAPTPVVSMSKWISGCYASCRGKNLSCSTTHATGCTYKSRGIVVGSVQTVAAIPNDESLQVRVRKAHPPEGRSSRHPSAHRGAKTGCPLTSRNAASLQKLFCCARPV